MKRSEFLKETIVWANGILSEPNYVMPNNKNSHDVALEEKGKSRRRITSYAIGW